MTDSGAQDGACKEGMIEGMREMRDAFRKRSSGRKALLKVPGQIPSPQGRAFSSNISKDLPDNGKWSDQMGVQRI